MSSTTSSVQVALRIRPLVPSEVAKGCKDVLEVYNKLEQVRIKNTDKAFTYNYVFSPLATQESVYEKCVKSLLDNIFQGYNVTILAYGQTGSGKTHSMGTTYNGEGEMGVIPHAITDMFLYIRDNFTYDFNVTVSFMELYQEVLFDLLSDKPRDQCVLEIREDVNKNINIPGLTEVTVQSVHEVFEALRKGASGRATGATNMNAQSSRSHAIFTINVGMQSKTNKADNHSAKFNLVDLAGSERQKKTGATGNTLKEGININKGLLVLGNVISALGDDKQQHGYIPYRDSSLTRLLKDSLGGNSITLMIACVSPADYNIEETISTMRYADRARKIQNKPMINQDPKQAEINELKKQIQNLKLQIVGEGGPIICPAEMHLQTKQIADQQQKIRDLTLQLSSSLNANTGLLEKLLILQNANEKLTAKLQLLKEEYNLTINNITIGLENNDTDSLKSNLTKLQSIQEHFIDLDIEQKKAENEIRQHEIDLQRDSDASRRNNSETTGHQDQEVFTNKQLALNKELENIGKQLNIKEHLAREIAANIYHMVDYGAMAETESKVQHLEKERDELLQQLKNSHHTSGPNHNKLAEQRRKRVQELESQLQDLKRKIQEQARLIKMKEKDEIKMKQLNNEIVQMKQQKVKLIRKMREENDKFNAWKQNQEKECTKLKKQDRKRQDQMAKMEAMHNKQQNVLKRKVEEAAALNKRLKDALALRKATQEMRHGKGEKIGNWVKHEMQLYVDLIEAEVLLVGLLEDRATLQEQLTKLKNSDHADEAQIKTIEDDLELRSLQIQDLQQKMLDSDEENRAKNRFDNIQVMSDAKFAMKTLLEEAGAIKKQEVATKTKLSDMEAEKNEMLERINKLENEVELQKQTQADGINRVHKEYEEKVAVLLRHLRGVEVQNGDQQYLNILQEKNEALEKELLENKKQLEEYKQKLKVVEAMARNGKSPLLTVSNENRNFKTPSPVRPKEKKTIAKEPVLNSTFVFKTENQENQLMDSSIEEDNLEKDPDWKKTPIGRYIKRLKCSTSLAPEITTRVAPKRSSGGGCMCQKTNCSKKSCSCRKFNNVCSDNCKCKETCDNRNKPLNCLGNGHSSETSLNNVEDSGSKQTLEYSD